MQNNIKMIVYTTRNYSQISNVFLRNIKNKQSVNLMIHHPFSKIHHIHNSTFTSNKSYSSSKIVSSSINNERTELDKFIRDEILTPKSSPLLEHEFSLVYVSSPPPQLGEDLSKIDSFEQIYSGEKTRVYRVTLNDRGGADKQIIGFLTTKLNSPLGGGELEDLLSDEKKKEIVTLFDESSSHWDLIMKMSGYRSVIEWLERSLDKCLSSSEITKDQLTVNSKSISILDCACGGGYTAATLHEKSKSFGIDASLMGLDISTGMLQKALEKGGPQLFNIGMACHDLDQKIDMIPDESFDLITCLGVIEFLSNFETVTILEFKRLLKKNGQMLLTTQYQPNENETNVEIDKDEHRLYNRQILNRILNEHDLIGYDYEIIERAYTSDRKKIPFIAFKVIHKQ